MSNPVVSGRPILAITTPSHDVDVIDEDMYMNPCTGSIDTLDGWYPYGEDDGLVRVMCNSAGEWVAA
jgi:hypothetical protein